MKNFNKSIYPMSVRPYDWSPKISKATGSRIIVKLNKCNIFFKKSQNPHTILKLIYSLFSTSVRTTTKAGCSSITFLKVHVILKMQAIECLKM